MKKTFLTLLFSVIATFSMADNHGTMTYHNNEFNVKSEYVVKIDKEYIFTVDTLILEKEEYFYGREKGENTPTEKFLKPKNTFLYNNDFSKTKEKFLQSQTTFNYLRILSNDTIDIIQNKSQTVATFRHFAPSDIEALLRICEFSIDCKTDTACVGDSIDINLILSNASWEFEGYIIFGQDTIYYKDKKFEGNSFFVAKEPIGATPLTIKGRLTHDKFAFDYEIEIKKIYIKEIEKEANIELVLIIVCSVGAVLLIVGVIVFFIRRNNKKKKAKLQEETESKQKDTKKDEDNNEDNKEKVQTLSNEVHKLKDKISRLENEHAKEVERLKREKETAEGKAKNIADERDRYHAKRYKELETEKKHLEKNLEEITAKYRKKISENEELQADIKNKKSLIENKEVEISNLNSEMQNYRERVDFIPYAVNYVKIVKKAIEIASQVSKVAVDLINKPGIDDTWHIVKAITKYNAALLEIDIKQFYTEVEMINNGQIVLKGTMISKFNTECSKEELDYSIKSYFFNSYLKRYMDALIVFNESMASIDRLTMGVDNADVAIFNEIRGEIEIILKELGITAEYVKLFDNVGEKIDLQAEVGDYGDFSSGTILEIENCIIYLTGSNRPETKIKVKIQE